MKTKRDDNAYYGAYGSILVSLGIFIILWSEGMMSLSSALLAWFIVLGTTIAMASAISASKTEGPGWKKSHGVVIGCIVIAMAAIAFLVIDDIINTSAAVGVTIIVAGIGAVTFGINNER